MRLIQSTLLGTAAVLAAAAGVQAADLPSRKAAPAEYVRICDVYGAGFYYIPGTNTCLKVGGRVRFELFWHKAQNAWVQPANGGAAVFTGARAGAFNAGARQDTLGWRARAYVTLDARTQTSWGTVQTVISTHLRSRSGNAAAGGTFAPGGQLTADTSVDAAYIRFAGFTFGRAPSLFTSGPGYLFYRTTHTSGSPIGTMQLAYTAVFGGGFSATLGLEDSNNYGRQNASYLVNSGVAPLFAGWNAAAPVYPSRLPNLVAGLRLDQGWGNFEVTASVGRTGAVFGTGAAASPILKVSRTGWGIGASTKINLPMLGQGDALYFFAAYCNGLDACANGDSTNGSIAKDGRRAGGYVPTFQNMTYHINAAGLPVAEASKHIMASVVLTHYWTPALRSNFAVSYMKHTPGSTSRSLDWFVNGGQPVSSQWTGQAQLVWSPTKGFDLGLELYYARGKNRLACPAGPCTVWGAVGSPTFGVKQNPDDLAVTFRAERTF